MRFQICLLAICVCAFTSHFSDSAVAQSKQAPQEVVAEKTTAVIVAEVAAAGKALIKSLDDAQYQKLQYAFTDLEQRDRWSNLPTSMVPRGGLRMGDLKDEQRKLVWAIIKATLSEYGYRQIVENVNGDETLGQASDGRMNFDSDEFYVSFLGEPSTEKPWMWQFGGHHLGINATIVGEQLTLSPTLTGGQPMTYTWEGKQVRQMATEIDAAYEFLGSLSEEQLKQAITGERYVDMIYGPGIKSIPVKPEGIQLSSLNEKQQQLMTKLIETRIGILKPAHTKLAMAKIVDQYEQTWFSWYGPTEKGKAATYRIQGPTLAMEYSPQRLGNDPPNHIHAMYRDPSNDFGVKMIKKD